MQSRRVVVTGLGAVTPLGNTVGQYWRNLRAGVSGAGAISKFDPSGFRTKFACEIKGFDPLDYCDSKEARRLDPYCHYALVAADEALRNSGVLTDRLDRTRTGVIWASGMGGLSALDEQLCEYAGRRGRPRFNPFFITKILTNMASGLISIRHGLQGVNFAPVSACASSTNAIAEALLHIRCGQAEVIVAGGSEAAITESGVGGFSAMKALSERNEAPETASRPFAADRDGFVMGEGAGALVLEELSHAQARGAVILAELVGAGMAADAYHMTATHPEGVGAYLAMRNALADAGLTPAAVDYLNAHATSTPQGDLSESKAIARLFGEHLPRLSISATKSMTGHLLGAAGAIEAIACVLAIQDQVVPPTINTKALDPEVPAAIDLTLGREHSRPIQVAMSNTFGFGGHNAIVVFKRFA
jgi:3-oxoacyl-[acyl-carrier-protein] synthase II